MDVQAVLQAIQGGDRAAVGLCRGAAGADAATLVTEVRRALPSLEEGSRRVVVACLEASGSPEAAELLLEMTDDDDLMIGASAAGALLRVPSPPPVDQVLAAARKRAEPFIRGRLYRLAGQSGDDRTLKALRSTVESNRDAARDVQIAAVKLGGEDERESFASRVEQALPDEVLDLGDALQYLGDPRLARHLIPWLSKADPVVRLGVDVSPVPRMARMSDMAVLFARQLGIAIPGPPELDVYSQAVLDGAEQILSALPEK